MLFRNTNPQFVLGLMIGLIIMLLPLEYRLLLVLILCPLLLMLVFIDLIILFNQGSYKLKVLEVNQDRNIRCLKIFMVNNNLLEDKNLFRGIYNTIMNLNEFRDFGYEKIIILSVILATDKEHNLHSNILINNDTTFEDYYQEVQPELSKYNTLQYGYHNEIISRFVIKVWNVDHKKNLKIKQSYSAINKNNFTITSKNTIISQGRSFSTSSIHLNDIGTNKKWYKGLIQPISLLNNKGELKQKTPNFFMTMDLETINLNGKQIPIAISSCGWNTTKYEIESKLFLINDHLLLSNKDLALKQLWTEYFNYLEKFVLDNNYNKLLYRKLTIFAHNLGEFDGYFLYNGLMMCHNPDNISSLIDESNSFISITHSLHPKFSLEWKDSLRIFPTSLDKLLPTASSFSK